MKKYILLLANLLIISQAIFSQNVPKTLWEKKIVETSFTPNFTFNTNGINISPNGNILLKANYSNKENNGNDYNIKAFDKNGNQFLSISDYIKTPNSYLIPRYIQDKYLYLESSSKKFNRDSIVYFDKNFNYLKTFNVNLPNTYALDVEDGVIYATTDNKFIKYDLNGKEEWQYQNTEPTVLVNTTAPYIGLEGNSNIQKKNILILNKNGKKIGRTDPQVYYKTYSTPDKGFWLLTDVNYAQAEYLKFDSTGKQTARFTSQDLPARWQSDVSIRLEAMKNNGLFSIYMNEKAEIVFLSLMPDGSLKKSIKGLEIKDVKNNFIKLDYRLVDDNNCMFFCNYTKVSQFSENSYIGVAKFDDTNLGWSKLINESIYGNTIRFNIGNENLFCIVDIAVVTRNFSTAGKLIIYNYDGSLKWKQSDQNNVGVIDFRRINDALYLKSSYLNNEFTSKVKFSDGSLIWTKPITINSLSDDIKFDKIGNMYIKYAYCTDSSYKYCSQKKSKIIVTSPDDIEIGGYSYPNPSDYGINSFGIDNENNLVTLSLESTNNFQNNSYTLRKIKFCGNNFNPTAPQISGVTEACPGEKAKLSTPKTEGVSYQWQKDGKDLTSEGKDVVQDVGVSGVYTVTIKDLTCLNSATSKELKVNIRSLPNTEIKTVKTTFCQGDKTNVTSTTNGTFFQWQKDEKDIPNATSANYDVTQSGIYRLGVKDDKCPQVGYSNIIPIEVKPLPEAIISTDIKTVIVEPFLVKMTANAGTGLTYQWVKNDTTIVNATTAVYETKKTGKFTVTVTKDGCSKTSEPLLISIQITLANETEIGEDEVRIYPNPSNGEFRILLPNLLKGADIQLFNVLGQQQNLIQNDDKLQAEGIRQGIYFLKVSKGEKVLNVKVAVY